MKGLLLTNSNIVAMDDSIKGDSILIEEGKIKDVGTEIELKEKAAKNVEIIDLKGKTVLPGFIDSHVHLLQTGFLKTQLDLTEVKSVEEIKNMIKEEVELKKPGEWIIGRGFDETDFQEGKPPNRHDLDEAAPENPVFLIRVCTHLFSANTKALEEANITENTPNPSGGTIYKDENKKPNGVLAETAGDKIYEIINKDSSMEKEAIRAGIKYLLENGITTAHSMAIGVKDPQHYARLMNNYKEVMKEENYPIRVFLGAEYTVLDYLIKNNIKFLDGDEYFKQGYIKFFGDGSIGGRTALLKEDYSDEPGTRGVTVANLEEMKEYGKKAHDNGYQCALHAIGDKAAENVLEAIKYIGDKENKYRHRMIHASIVDDEILKTMAEYKVSVNIQPMFLASDYKWLDSRLGPIRKKNAYIWNKMKNLGIILAASSDTPVEKPNPFYGIQSAVTRKTLEGNPENGFLPEEGLSVNEMLNCYSYNGAYQYFEDDKKGSITPGKLGDLVVVSDDPLKTNIKELKNIKTLMTIVNGKIVYKDKDF